MSKTYQVTFADTALPGVLAVGTIRRGQTVEVEAAEALRLVRTKGLTFATAADKVGAEKEVAAVAAPAEPPPLPAASAATTDTTEEH